MATTRDVTEMLLNFDPSDPEAFKRLFTLLYPELSRLASQQLRPGDRRRSFTTGALVSETYVRLVDPKAPWQNRRHFFGVAANCMRQILIDEARKSKAAKRGGGWQVTSFDEMTISLQHPVENEISSQKKTPDDDQIDLIALDLALEKLKSLDERQHEAMNLRLFAGRSNEEIAEILGIGLATVKRDVSFARAWLTREINPEAK